MANDGRGVADLIARIRDASALHLEQRAAALAWRDSVSAPCSLLWLPESWLHEPEQMALRDALLASSTRSAIQATGTDVKTDRRLLHRATQHVAARVVLDELLSTVCPMANSGCIAASIIRDAYLQHTALGAPRARLRGAPLRALLSAGMKCRDLHISFTHDGGAHLAIASCAHGLRGLGVDMVYLPRLLRPGKDAAYLRRFARAFMPEPEYERYAAVSRDEEVGAQAVRTAAHFSLMEAASKALGTGLRIGAGMGKQESLPKRSLNVLALKPEVVFDLANDARARCAALNASRLAGYWAADDEYLVSWVMLWE